MERLRSTCAIIPAHNEAGTVAEVVRGASLSVEAVLVVDDGSGDETGNVARACGAHLARHPIRRGKGMALRTGFAWARAAGFDRLVTLDADGQHDPAEIGRLAALDESADLVIGARSFDGDGVPTVRAWANRLSTAVVSRLSGRALRDSQSGFRWIRREMLDRIPLRARGFDVETELLVLAAWMGARIVEVPVRTLYGTAGSDFRAFGDSAAFVLRVARLALGRRGSGSRRGRDAGAGSRADGPGAGGGTGHPRREGARRPAPDAAAPLSTAC